MSTFCGECKYCYSNDSMGNLYLCTNGYSNYCGEFVSAIFDPACEDYDGPEDEYEEVIDDRARD